MSLESQELYDLFLALASPRVDAARPALLLEAPQDRRDALRAALVPLAVDAALLGADGLSDLARAIAESSDAASLPDALDRLEAAASALGTGDASGARVDETALRNVAQRLGDQVSVPPGAVASTSEPQRDRTPTDESAWEPDLDDDMVAAFLDECSERVDALGGRLLELETARGDGEVVNAVFRDLHTLKGSSAFAGLTKMNRVAHLAEDLVGELRDGKRAADRDLVDVLLETLDVLSSILDRARTDRIIAVDAAPVVSRLEALLAGRAPLARSAKVVETRDDATAHAARPATRATTQETLRIDFAKVDQLLNLVGEVVLARGRLDSAADVQGSILEEVETLRKRVARGSNDEATNATVKELVTEELQRTERVLRETSGDLDAGLRELSVAAGQLRDHVMQLRMVPIDRLFSKYQRTVRELSNKLEKKVHIEIEGADTELDKVLVERLEDPLLHLVRNAIDHGIEVPAERAAADKPVEGTLRLRAKQRGGQVVVIVEDDGAGMDASALREKAIEKQLLSRTEAEALSDAEAFELIFRAGFSTAKEVSDVSGRGVGMDVVREAIARLKGTIAIESTLGLGTRLELRLPLTLAITRVLAARVSGETIAVPLDAVVSARAVAARQLERVADGVCLIDGETLIPVVDLADILGLGETVEIDEVRDSSVIIVAPEGDPLALLVRQVLGRHEVVIKSLGPLLSGTPCAAGATLVGDRVLLVVDVAEVARRARDTSARGSSTTFAPALGARAARAARVLVAEDSSVIRETLRRELTAAGYDVEVAEDGAAALELARSRTFDAISTDVMMPKMDGYELTRALRTLEAYRSVPIVMVTSKDARIDTMRGYDAGADAYITKPADARALVQTLESLLTKRGQSS